MKKIVLLLLVICLSSLVLALAPCQSGGLTTSIHKDNQMIYQDEDFLRIDNKDSLKVLGQLKDLTCLQYLDATEWDVKGDIANLKKLENLEVLSLYGNPDVYGDFCSLSGLIKLRVLKFAFDPKVYGDISCLKNLNLETFAMTYTNLTGDLSDLSHMAKLKAVYVSGTGISGDLSSLSKLTNLEELGISDEYPGNPKIIGDLASLDNLTKLKKVSLYNTKAENCEYFTKMHPNIEQGGCSKESLKTLKVHNIRAEKKIGKDRYEGSPPDYGNEADKALDVKESKRNIFARFFGWLKSLFSRDSSRSDKKESFALTEVSDGGPPKECTIDGEFIGEEKCKAMVEKAGASSGTAPDSGPPKECIINGEFIGKEKCKAMVEGSPSEDGKGWCQTEEECDALIKENLYGKK